METFGFFAGLFLIELYRYFPIWLPIFLAFFAYHVWFMYKQHEFRTKMNWVLLEIKIPREITKNPKAMEAALSAFYITSAGGEWAQWSQGSHMSWSSLEICSFGGKIHFYIRVLKNYRNIVESEIYAHYPEVEIAQVDDYVNNIPYELPGYNWNLWGAEWKLVKHDAYPILTYIDYAMDKDPDEEFKIDPMSPIIEFMGMIRPSEQVWLQIMIRPATVKRYPVIGKWFEKTDWQGESKELIKKLSRRDKKEAGMFSADTILTPGERKVLEAVERSLGKLAFDTGMRLIYWSRAGDFSVPNVQGVLGMFRQFNSADLNAFKPSITSTYDEPWQDPFGNRSKEMRDTFWKAYRDRGWFYFPHERKPFVLTSEELASVYHFPSKVVETPTLERIESKKGEAPANLPV